jgi:predicted Fe-Mo cluster-binding NifX family protein
MKIAISSKGTTLKDNTHLHFGRCDYFIIYDLENGEVKAIENKGLTSSQGAGIAAAQQVIDENIEVIISGKLGPNAYQIINGEGIKILQCEEKTVEEAIDDFKNNKLQNQNESGMAHEGMK